ncbi:MAG: hypothetical protein ACXAB4_06040 [Candidatus Hodarchaeales archaeon]|jgi:hypothetical protein
MKQSKDAIHLCWDCRKAEDQTCLVYNQLVGCVEDNFDQIEIHFQVPSCEFFEEEEMLSTPGEVVHRSTTL